MKCEFCSGYFTSIYTLKRHQETTKKCLEIQEKVKKNDYIRITCDICNKTFLTYDIYKTHYTETCGKIELIKIKNEYEIKIAVLAEKVENKDIMIKEKDKEIREKNEELEKMRLSLTTIASKPTMNNNIRIQNLTPLIIHEDKIKDAVDNKFTYEYFMDGQVGVANFTYDHIIKNDNKIQYICTDPNRLDFKYKDNLGNINRDIRCKQLTNVLKEKIIPKSRKIYMEKTEEDVEKENLSFYNTQLGDILSICTNNLPFSKELARLTINDSKILLTTKDGDEYEYIIESD